MSDVTTMAFLWGNWCPGMGPQYVNALHNGLVKHLNYDFKFVLGVDEQNEQECRSKCTEGVSIRVIDSPSWKGCLPKLNAYNPDLGATGRVLVFDLDSIIVDSVDPFVDAIDDGLTTRSRFKGSWASGGDLLGFKTGWGEWIWRMFNEHTDYIVHTVSEEGRERFIYRKMVDRMGELSYWQAKLPGKYLSYKNHLRGKDRIPEGASIISCHGHPRPHEIKEDHIRQAWEELC